MAEQSGTGSSALALVRCPACGKLWPENYSACPHDGTALGAHDTQPAGVHVAETLLLPDRRQQWSDTPTVAVDSETRIDAVAFGREDSDTKPRVEEIQADDLIPFSANDSDLRTVAAARAYTSSPPPAARGPGSSDPPTSTRRRYDAHIDLPPGSIVNDEYEIANRLGAGAMGEVYAARHMRLNKRVAIKVISPRLSEDTAAIERFEQEARTLAQLHHPGIVDVLGFGELADGRAYFTMEFLSGEALDDRLDRGRVPFDQALDVLDQVARALEAAHLHGVTHRDLKPANIYLVRVPNEARPIVKLVDFGLAKLAVDVDQRAERTQSGAVIGTPTHLSPEQARGPDVDHRTDIYSLGCTAYELLLGRPPFGDAKTIAALIAAHIHETPAMPREIWAEIPPQLDLLLFAMLAKDAAHRPTLVQVRQVIASVQANASTQPRPVSPGGARAMTAPVQPLSSRSATLMIAGAAMIGGIVIGALAPGSGSSEDKPHAVGTSSSAERADGGVASVVIPNVTVDASAPIVPPTRSIAAAVSPPRKAQRAVVDGGSPVVAMPRIDAATREAEPVGAIVIDAAVEPTATIEIDGPVTPATVRPVHRTTPPPAPVYRPPPKPKKATAIDRNQTVNPFSRKPASR